MALTNEYTIIGIDGGGTHTRGVLVRDDKVISHASSGTARIGSVGVGEACERTLNIILELCNKAEIETSELDAVVVGLAGVWLEEEKKRAAQLLRTLARQQSIQLGDLLVTSDAELAIEGALGNSDGIITIVGTGSIGLARIGKNQLYRCGGWGIELDDEGSGAWIGREGLTAVVRALDGRGKPTELTAKIPQFSPIIDMDRPRTIVKAYQDRAFEYHNLTPAVMECAVNGDQVCLEIITRAANHLLELPVALSKYFKTKTIKVALMGGIIEANTLLAQMLKDRINEHGKFEIIEPSGSALDGAISIGRRLIEQDM